MRTTHSPHLSLSLSLSHRTSPMQLLVESYVLLVREDKLL